MYIKKKGIYHKVNPREILFFEADNNYVLIHLLHNNFMIKAKIGQIEKKMENDPFLRVHRSYIVNIEKIDTLDFTNNELQIAGHKISFNPKAKIALKEHLDIWK